MCARCSVEAAQHLLYVVERDRSCKVVCVSKHVLGRVVAHALAGIVALGLRAVRSGVKWGHKLTPLAKANRSAPQEGPPPPL